MIADQLYNYSHNVSPGDQSNEIKLDQVGGVVFITPPGSGAETYVQNIDHFIDHSDE